MGMPLQGPSRQSERMEPHGREEAGEVAGQVRVPTRTSTRSRTPTYEPITPAPSENKQKNKR